MVICHIRERGSTLYVGMARRKPAKDGYVQLNIERSYYKLALKASEHIPLRNNRASKLPVFVFFFFFFAICNSRTKGATGAILGRNY